MTITSSLRFLYICGGSGLLCAIPFCSFFLPEDLRLYYLREFLSREESYNKKFAILTFTTKPKWQLEKEKEKKKKKRNPIIAQ
jgi:hypothetical protein